VSTDPTIPVFYGNITGGKINLEKRECFSDLIHALEGKEIEIRLAKRRRQRSLGQNAYFHGVCLPMIAEACGYDRSELGQVKDGLKAKFLTVRTLTGRAGDGENTLHLVRGTSDLDTHEFTIFIEDCRRWAAEALHLNIPDPT
jgi:hypothetical protein